MYKIIKLCCGGRKCPKLAIPVIKDDSCASDNDYYIIKDEFGGTVKLTLEQLQYLKNVVDRL